MTYSTKIICHLQKDESKESAKTANKKENSEPQLLPEIYEEVRIRLSHLYENITDRPVTEENVYINVEPVSYEDRRHKTENELTVNAEIVPYQQFTLDDPELVRKAREEVEIYWRDAENTIKEVQITTQQKATVEKVRISPTSTYLATGTPRRGRFCRIRTG